MSLAGSQVKNNGLISSSDNMIGAQNYSHQYKSRGRPSKVPFDENNQENEDFGEPSI